LRCSIELWLRFALHTLHSLVRFRLPTYIAPDDVIARELYSGHVSSSGRLSPGAFKPVPANGFSISVNRWTPARDKLFIEFGHRAAARRTARRGTTVTLKGFAYFTVEALRDASTPEIVLNAESDITRTNPFHANIPFPSDREEDYYLEVQTLILEKVQPITCLLR